MGDRKNEHSKHSEKSEHSQTKSQYFCREQSKLWNTETEI